MRTLILVALSFAACGGQTPDAVTADDAVAHADEAGEHAAHGEDHDAHAIVEQALARDRALERGGHVLFAQHAEDRDGIGGRDQRAEHEVPDRGDRSAQQQAKAPGCAADQHGRGDDADGGEQQHRQPVRLQPIEIDMQRGKPAAGNLSPA